MAAFRNKPGDKDPAAAGGDEDIPPPRASPAEAGEADFLARAGRRKRLLVWGGIAGAVTLLVGAAAGALWVFLPTAPKAKAQRQTAPHHLEVKGGAAPATGDETLRKELEVLKKRNEEMAAQLESLKREKAPLPEGNALPRGAKPIPPSAAPPTGEVQFSAKDPKASAQALKRAIEEMNAAADQGGSPRKGP